MGIPASLFLAVLGITGAILVYEKPLDRLIYPTLHVVRPGTTRLPWDSLVAIADRAAPRPAKANWIIVPDRPDEAARVQYRFHQVFMDPYRGTILGERGMGHSVIAATRAFHRTFLIPRIGLTITLILTGAAVLLTLGGVILWWPRKIVRFRWRTPWRRINYDLHNISGIVGVVGILLFGGTALMMAAGDVLDPIYRRTMGDAPDVRLLPGSPRSAQPVSIDSIARIAEVSVAGPIREISIPRDAHGTYRVQKQTPGEYGQRARNIVFIDGNDGRVRGVIDQNARPMGTRVQMLTEDWHVAAFAPEWSRWFGILSCLMLAFTSATGPLIWWKPRRKAKGARSMGKGVLALAVFVAPMSVRGQEAPPTITVSGAVSRTLTLTAADLAAMPRATVTTTSNGIATTYEGVWISELLTRAGVALGPGARGGSLSTYVLAVASDGYQVLFSMGEVDPALSEGKVLVADRANGAAMYGETGAFRLVVPTDKRGARSIRLLSAIRVVQVPR